jgi:hypothetical protein
MNLELIDETGFFGPFSSVLLTRELDIHHPAGIKSAESAAAMAVAEGTAPRGIYRNHMSRLQQTLPKHDQYILRVAKQNTGDLARSASVHTYRIDCEVDGRWPQVVGERLNFQRFQRQRFDPVRTRKLRLTVESTHGAPFARVFEIRAYAEDSPFAG